MKSITMKKHLEPEWYNIPVKLAEEQRQHPYAVIHEFFSTYHLDDLREILSEWVQVAVTADNSVYPNAQDRSNLFHFYKSLEIFIEAAFALVDRKSKKKSGV